MSEALEIYKRLALQADSLDRQMKYDEMEVLHEQMDVLYDEMSEEERGEAKSYSIELYNAWTPEEHYKEALRVIEEFPKPSPNDKTTPEARAAQLAYWTRRRDEAKVKMELQTKESIDGR